MTVNTRLTSDDRVYWGEWGGKTNINHQGSSRLCTPVYLCKLMILLLVCRNELSGVEDTPLYLLKINDYVILF